MATGPFSPALLPVYDLQFSDSDGPFTIRAHLSKTGERTANKLGLDIEASNLTALCHDPKAGSSRVKHDMVATVSPDWDGLTGTFRVKAQPDSSFIPITQALGRTYYGEFEQTASSVDDGADWAEWQRTRRTRTGLTADTRAPVYSIQTETVRLKLVRSSGDETSDVAPTAAVVIARAGTLQVGDVLTRDDVFIVTTTPLREGEYEQANLSLRG